MVLSTASEILESILLVLLGNEAILSLPPHKLPTAASIIPYSRKIWRGIKFGGLAVCVKTAKLKSTKIFYTCMYVWRYHTIPPNLSPLMVLKTSFWAKPPNLMTANISGYMVYCFLSLLFLFHFCTNSVVGLQDILSELLSVGASNYLTVMREVVAIGSLISRSNIRKLGVSPVVSCMLVQ